MTIRTIESYQDALTLRHPNKTPTPTPTPTLEENDMFTLREQYYLAYSLLREMYAGRVRLRDTSWSYLNDRARNAAIRAVG